MSHNTTLHLPPLLGGYPIKEDLIPSIVCSALYALLLPLFAYRLFRKSARTCVLIPMLGLVIERSIVFGLRAAVSREPRDEEGFEASKGLMEYMQTSLFMGIVPVSQVLAMLVRTMLVDTTYGTEAAKEIPRLQEYLPRSGTDMETATELSPMERRGDAISMKTSESKSAWSFSGTTIVEDWTGDYPDKPRMRFWFRRIHDAMTVAFVIVFVTGLIGNCRLIEQRNSPEKLKENEILRYISTSLIVLVLIVLNSVVFWALQTIPRMNKWGSKYVLRLSVLLLVPAVYRFIVMAQRTTAYYSYENSAQNGVRDKALFHIIDVLPEWLAVFMCLCIDVRKVFQTGVDGDTRWWDETPAEKEKRLLREKEKELQKGDGLISVPVISRLSRGKYVRPLISS